MISNFSPWIADTEEWHAHGFATLAHTDEGDSVDLALLIHSGPRESTPWANALHRLRLELKADHAALVLRQPSPHSPALTIDASRDGVKAWRGGYSYYSVFTRDPFSGLPAHRVVSVDEVVGAAEWERSEFYRKYIRPLNVRYILGADILTENRVECRFRVSRSAAAGEFGARERRICDELLPHLKVSIDTHAQLDALGMERDMYAQTMEHLLVGVVILDEAGAIMRSNGIACDILAEKDGLRLCEGTLRAEFGREDNEIQRLIRQALKGAVVAEQASDEVLPVSRPSGRVRLGVLVRPIPLGAWSQGRRRPAVAIFLRDPERRVGSSQETTRRLFGLTAAEAVLANHLANGLTLDEAAAVMRIARNTARAHLRSIFAKTGVTRQTMLVRVLLNSVGTLSEDGEVPAAERAARSAG
ncbi:MAG: helix-turn-helix transcriptional regulator [Rudaea sp.]|uniref:helix-turn-helix transcriptional regulator n=1 Tax=Rudaea sp. TaxID=2136325 RepID=UPI0039E6DCD9